MSSPGELGRIDSVDDLLQVADLLLLGGDPTAALEQLDLAAEAAPADPRPYLRRAEILIARAGGEDCRAALVSLERAAALHPAESRLHFLRMRACYALGEVAAAQAAYEAAVAADPQDTRLREWGLRLALAAGDPARALRLAREAIATNPTSLSWRRWEAELLLQMGDDAAACAALTALVAHMPPDLTPGAWDAAVWGALLLARAGVQRRLGDLAAARADLDAAAILLPGDPGVDLERGLLIWASGAVEEAYPLLRAALVAAAPGVRAGFWASLAGYPRLAALQADLAANASLR